jgi:hypothetical protein
MRLITVFLHVLIERQEIAIVGVVIHFPLVSADEGMHIRHGYNVDISKG